MGRKKIFSSVRAGEELLEAMAEAIRNITEEIKRPIDTDQTGSGRRAELKSIKESALDAKELITEYQKLETMIKELKDTGGIEGDQDFGGGFSEQFAKR
jgi:cell shape-determining protein MreC